VRGDAVVMKNKLPSLQRSCKKLSCQYGIINTPEIIPMKYSHVGKSVILGYYNNNENKIEINKYAIELWTLKQIIDVIKHELIHARCYRDFGHGGHGVRFGILCELCGVGDNIKRAVRK
jgi:predicted SprT family Zn-dependent metalloprotease